MTMLVAIVSLKQSNIFSSEQLNDSYNDKLDDKVQSALHRLNEIK